MATQDIIIVWYTRNTKKRQPSLVRLEHLTRRVIFLQELNMEIKDKKGSENVLVDHLSHLESDKGI